MKGLKDFRLSTLSEPKGSLARLVRIASCGITSVGSRFAVSGDNGGNNRNSDWDLTATLFSPGLSTIMGMFATCSDVLTLSIPILPFARLAVTLESRLGDSAVLSVEMVVTVREEESSEGVTGDVDSEMECSWLNDSDRLGGMEILRDG